ncbi:DNA cytosine methyltransferase [Croceimicrobium hydrocarbonivorans]|uniref:DNA (cytosine-5-)-methyltransferase n=1 Tax=Croceimicrobium hydrocarbonivorans TaxID=2761580 RepID=A0A7H0VB44_9FLAO|nr:DNA cytosine methyltransferase [Croceimicrobium hydrocarbonivorans]QNR22942.1 DNA cytosine methyltransferase [Croceimicrobium hydrocarbonivorans]QNR22985.1 DNA cytosine methyltransferase [Croceimicrobium hydrocarbonivorans]
MNRRLTVGGLFSGDGGFELAAQWAGLTPVWSNDFNKHCCAKLRRNFGHRIIEKDINEIDPNELESVDIICGGDPCQPSSLAGLGKGTEDHRYNWPAKFRIVRALHPSFVLNENVVGTITNGILDRKIDDLESEGYTCQAYTIPAEAVGALHRRDRVWLVAYDPNRKLSEARQSGEKNKHSPSKEVRQPIEPVDLWPFDTYPDSQRLHQQHNATQSKVLSEGVSRYFGFGPSAHGNISRDIIESGIIRMLNGLPEGMDYADRNNRIAEMGNAIVPQLAYEFFLWMKSILK